MKKRILSLVLTVALMVGIIYPALQIGAKAVNDKVMLSATASDNITIQKPDELPEEGDFNGVLSLSSGTFSIERDYAQKATVSVTNTGESNMEYYLVAKNIYKDIYMNFVRNGSPASPLVIQPGETQSVQLDIFAQNAEQGEYTIPVYAMVIKGDSEVEDAKSTMTLTCDITELKMTCSEISSNKSTLAKTLRLTNRGGALTDVTLSFEGDLADYVQLNPIVSNYQMNSGSFVEVKAIPDLTKMKNNKVSAISGKLVASSGGQKATFDLTFDTKGEEITSTTMGELMLDQMDCLYDDFDFDKNSISSDVSFDGKTMELTGSFEAKYYFDNNKDNGFTLTNEIDVRKYDSSSEFEPVFEVVSVSDDKVVFKFSSLIDIETYKEAIINSSAIKMSEDELDTQKWTYEDTEYYVCDNVVTLSDGLFDTIQTNAWSALWSIIRSGQDIWDSAGYLATSMEIWNNPEYSQEQKWQYDALAAAYALWTTFNITVTIMTAGQSWLLLDLALITAGASVQDMLEDAMDKIKNNPAHASVINEVEGAQCTNAGKITVKIYMNGYAEVKNIPVKSVLVSADDYQINVGESTFVTSKVYPENATNKSLKWETSNPEIATVSNGVVTAVGPGTAAITASAVYGHGIDSVRITVKQPVTGVKLSRNEFPEIDAGCSFGLQEKVFPENASNKKVIWMSSDPSVATVDENGIVTALTAGNVEIKVKTVDGGFTDTCSVTIKENGAVQITPSSASIPINLTSSFAVFSTSDNVKINRVTFSSDDSNVATVDSSGVVTGVMNGSTTIVAVAETNAGNYLLTAGVEVVTPVEDVALYGIGCEAEVGETFSLGAEVIPYDAANKNVTWSTSNSGVATVDQSGSVNMVGPGTVTITVTTEEGGFTDDITYTVVDKSVLSVMSKTSTENADGYVNSGVSLHITSRMYGGDGVNRYYGDKTGTDYVDIADTTYTYTLNGTKVGTSYNSGVTDVSVVELPVDKVRFGEMNTIICDYNTDPGHYFVNTNTQITVTYPVDTPVSYIGTPEDLEDVRSLPDFAIYSENIFGSSENVVIGNTSEINFNVYNRGSFGGWFDIDVKCGNESIYTEENHYLDAFSGEKIAFDWIPENETQDITVTLTNKCVYLEERTTDNNTATRTFKARTRVVPTIDSITPDYATEGEGIVFATVSDYADVIKTEFYVDDVLYTGEVKSSVVDGKMRYWINDPSMAEGERTIKVVVTYATGNTTTATIEKSTIITVLDADWKNYEFVLDTSFSSPSFYIFNKKTDSYNRTYDVTRNGENCVLTLTKDMYDNPADYILFVSCYNGFAYKNLIDKTTEFDYEAGNTLEFVGNDNIYFSSITYKSFDGNAVNVYGGYNSSVSLTPAKYCVEVRFTCYGENKTANLEVDLTEGDKTVDLASLISKYTFEFADEINGMPSARMFYRYGSEGYWNSFMLKQSLTDNTLTCVVSDYNIDAFNNASEAFILITTNDSAFVTDVKPETTLPEVISLDKSKVQKYTLNAGNEEISYVKVDCERFNIHLYSTTVYLQPGEYDITIVFNSDNVNTEGFLSSQAVDSETAEITLDWSDAYKGKGAYVYALSETGKEFTVESYKAGTAVEVEKDRYSVKTNIVRNNSYYTVESTADASDGDAKVDIGNVFEGKITNTFGTIDGGSTIRIYLDDLTDKNGNTLTYFNSKDAGDNLIGYITFRDVSDKLNTYSVYVSLDNVSSFDVRLPDVSGTYSVSLEAMTENETVRDVSGIEFDVSDIAIALGQTYKLTAEVYPENAINKNVTWKSSNPDVVSVDENGNITASKFANGTVYITATTEDGEYSATCKVTVRLTWWQTILKFILLNPVYRYVMELIY